MARQLLLERRHMPAAEAVEHLVGQQAQVPITPYIGLWSRLEGFEPAELSGAIERREAVRMPLMRATIHLVTSSDALSLSGVTRSVLARTFSGQSNFVRGLAGADTEEITAFGRRLLEERPRTRVELRPLLSERWPDADADALAYAVSYLVPHVQVPPRGLWRASGQATLTTPEAWLGTGTDPPVSTGEVIVRYLAAFGPAGTADMRTWSGLSGLRAVVERLRPSLRTFHDEKGRELFDLPDAPRPDPDTPAPTRFLPEYDNVMLSHADRGRVTGGVSGVQMPEGRAGVLGSLLVDGFFGGMWRITRRRGLAVLRIEHRGGISRGQREDLAEEGARLLAFVEPEAGSRDVELVCV